MTGRSVAVHCAEPRLGSGALGTAAGRASQHYASAAPTGIDPPLDRMFKPLNILKEISDHG